MKQQLQSLHPLFQMGLLILLGFMALFVFFMLSLIPFMVNGMDVFEVLQRQADLSDAEVIMLKSVQIAQAVGLFLTPYLLFRWYTNNAAYSIGRMRGGVGVVALFAVVMLTAFPLINLLAEWNGQMVLPEFLAGVDEWIHEKEEGAERLIRSMLAMDSIGDLLFNLFLIALLPAVTEEMFFRGMIQPLTLRMTRNYHVAIWLTAFIFSFFHLQFLGFVPRMLLGALLGYAAHWSGSLVVPMVGHFLHNGLAVLVMWYIGVDALDQEVEQFGANEGEVSFALFSAGIMLAGMSLFYKLANRKQKALPSEDERA